MSDLSGAWLATFGGLALISLVPIVWAIVDVLRRPSWQFSTGRKVIWALTLGVGWLLLWPLALLSSLFYLLVLRRRYPPTAPGPSDIPNPAAPVVPEIPINVPPAGWYQDPAGGTGERWWDGKGWSEHLR